MIGLSRYTANRVKQLIASDNGTATDDREPILNQRPMSFVKAGEPDGDYYGGTVVVWEPADEVWEELDAVLLREANDGELTVDTIYLAQRVGTDEDGVPIYQTHEQPVCEVCVPTPPESGEYILVSIDGVLTWVELSLGGGGNNNNNNAAMAVAFAGPSGRATSVTRS